jgi:hypothetical protein
MGTGVGLPGVIAAETRGWLLVISTEVQNEWSYTCTPPLCLHSLRRKTAILFAANTGRTQKNGTVSKVNKNFMSHITRAQHTPSAAATVHVSHALPAVRFSCLLRGRGPSFKDGVAAGEGFLCAPF